MRRRSDQEIGPAEGRGALPGRSRLRCSLRMMNLKGSLQVKRFPRFLEPRSRGVSQSPPPPSMLRHTEAGADRLQAASRPRARLRWQVEGGVRLSPLASGTPRLPSFSSTWSRIDRNVSSAIAVHPLSRPGGVAAAERPRSDPVEKPWSRPLP